MRPHTGIETGFSWEMKTTPEGETGETTLTRNVGKGSAGPQTEEKERHTQCRVWRRRLEQVSPHARQGWEEEDVPPTGNTWCP